MEIGQSPLEDMVTEPESLFWRGKKVLVTGHTGFKGAWLSLWLHRLGARVTGLALPPATDPNLFSLARLEQLLEHYVIDIRDKHALANIVEAAVPEIVFHLAAQPLVRPSYADPLETFEINVLGTANLLEALRHCSSLRATVAVTTDKVYKNFEWCYPYRENDSLGGHDPYSASKTAAEIVAACYRDAFFGKAGPALATARAGNVIGGGDWSPERLVPDLARAFRCGETLHVRRPDAVRPWQHVLEPLAGYMRLARRIYDNPSLAGAYNFGPHAHEAMTVREVVEHALRRFEGSSATFGTGGEGPHEAGRLTLETAKAERVLGVRPVWSTETALDRTLDWYVRCYQGEDARELCLREIEAYECRLDGWR